MAKKTELAEVVETKKEVKAMTEEQAQKLVQTITNKYDKIDRGFLGIMGDIAKAYDNGVHTFFGYLSFYDMASDMWGIGRTSVKNMVAINNRFGEKYKIAENWKEYGTSKLLLIKDLSDEEIEQLEITADLSREDIKDRVNEYKGIGVNKDKEEGQPLTEEETEDDAIDVDANEVEEANALAQPKTINVSHETLELIAKFAEEYADEYKPNVANDFYDTIKAVAEALADGVNVLFNVGE